MYVLIFSTILYEAFLIVRRTGRDMMKYRVFHESFRDFRPLRYSSRDAHAERERVNRGKDTPSFCPTLQVLDMSTLGDAVPATHVERVWQELDYRIDICRVTKGGHIEHL